MRKKDLIKKIAKKCETTQEVVRTVLDEFVDIMKDNFVNTDDEKERYIIKGFGTIQRRKYVSIKDGERSIKNTIRFKISEEFKDIMNS